METLVTIEERRSIRKYQTREIDKEIVEDILNCGRMAPSAKNRQPWFFVIVSGDIKNKIVEMMDKYSQFNKELDEEVYPKSISCTGSAIKQAPCLILILKEKNDAWFSSDMLSVGACVQNMCLRATDLGVESLWISDICYVSKEVTNLIGHTELELSCALAIGYPDQFPKMRPRKELQDILEWHL